MFSTQHLRRFGLCAFISAVLAANALAQTRIYGKVEPNVDVTDKLIFDTNLSASDNISPNIIFSPDEKRGFVAYAGSGVVMVFSMESSQVLARIKTGGKPQWGIVLPDNHTIAYVSMMDNYIYLIDENTSNQVGFWTYNGAQFGFGSVPVLSPDGTYLYISSTGSGEVLKIRVADGHEEGRIKGLQGPARLAISKDGTVLIVVDTITEQVLFMDSSTLTTKATLATPANAGINFTIFNAPVLAPDGATGVIASQDNNGTLGSDTVFLFRTATGELVDKASIGNSPGFTGLTPDGKYWVILNEFSISLIPTADFKSIRSLDLTNGDALGSATIAFSPDSRYMYYAASPHDVVFQHDLVQDAIVGQMIVGDNPNTVLDQPATVAITSDGKRIAVLEYVSNNIDLITSATTVNAAKFITSPTLFTGITVLNLSGARNKITVYALDNYGSPMSGTGITNPVTYTLEPNAQISQTVQQIFNFDATKETSGWISVFSQESGVTGYFSIGDNNLNRLDAAAMFRGRMFDWIVPEVARKEGTLVEMNFTSPIYNQGTYDLTRYAADGTSLSSTTGNVAYPTNRQTSYFGDLFQTPAEVSDGYLRIKAPKGLMFTEVVNTPDTTVVMNGIDISNYSGVTRVYSPQFAVTPDFTTILNIINLSTESADITVTLHGPDGAVIGHPYTKTFTTGQQLKSDLATIFKDDPAVSNVTGWLEVSSTKTPVLGTVSFTDTANRFKTTFELQATPRTNFLFPVVAEDDVYMTGVALLNPGDAPAHVTLELWGPGGTLDQSASVTLAPGSRRALYLPSFFPDMGSRLNGHVRVHSDNALYGFSLIHDASFRFMTAIPALSFP